LKAVICNQAADLDSIACAVVYADTIGAKAIVPISREDLRLRAETEFLLKKAGYSRDDILFDGEFEPSQIEELVLVDHNVLPKELEFLNSRITEVIDHHADECTLPIHKIIARTGSCASLVTKRITELRKPLSAKQAFILLGPILIDTRNLVHGHPTTQDDIEAAQLLAQKAGVESSALFKELWEIKKDLSKFTQQELLRKDYKEVVQNGTKVGFSTIYEGLETLSISIIAEAEKYRVQKELNYLIIMTADHSTEPIRKELAILPHNKMIIDYLNQNGTDLVFKMQMDGITVYNMKNTTYSRKQVLPLVKEILELI